MQGAAGRLAALPFDAQQRREKKSEEIRGGGVSSCLAAAIPFRTEVLFTL